MGGLIIIFATVLPTLLFAKLDTLYIWLALLALLWMGIVGFIDDYLKVKKKKKRGLIAKYKLIGQVSLGLVVGLIIVCFSDKLAPGFDQHLTETTLPFFKDRFLNFGILYIPMVILVLTATSNGVNLSDGLDGLAIGLVAIATIAVAAMCYITGNVKYSDYLNIIYLQNSGELTVFAAALLGAALGFLWYNTYPAEIFMGDTGSLAIGSAMAMMFILIKKELLLLIIGGVFAAEAASVLLQVSYFKYSRKKYGEGRKIFLMTPLHHHFELLGWPESRVVVRLWIVEILLVLISLTTFKIR